ncbi:DNA-3-methyladenine glycosylase 1 [Ensifer psoraleae]|nr:DNA-3-methyladenine glycosylase 1 [Sinorhizobium psoraleae]
MPDSAFEPDDDGARPQSRSTSPASEALSKGWRRRGWEFVGPTTVHAFIQAMGLVNDHTEDCFMGGGSRKGAIGFASIFMMGGTAGLGPQLSLLSY